MFVLFEAKKETNFNITHLLTLFSHKLRRELVSIYIFHCEKMHWEFVRHATKRDLETKQEGISDGK